MNKIKVTQNIVADSMTKGMSINDMLAQVYEGEIADRCKSNEAYKQLKPLEMAMADAGLTKGSLIKDFYTDTSNEFLFPAIVDTRIAEITASNPILQYIVSTNQTIDGTSVKGMKLDWTSAENKKALNKRDVSEGADLPIVKITTGDRALNLYKRGVAVQATYESIMYSRLDLFMRTVAAIAAHSANQQTGDAIDVLINGDGNNNAASTVNTAGTGLTAADIISFAVDFSSENNNLPMDTIVTNPDMAKVLLTMTYNANNENGYRPGATFNFPQYDLKNITVIGDSRVPAKRVIGLNRENALTRYVAAGSQINEIASNIRNQTKLSTLSEIVGFGKFIDTASKVLIVQ